MIATPVDKPVLNIDFYFEALYRKVDNFWTENKITTNQYTNCTKTSCTERNNNLIENDNTSMLLNELLLITIGGGSRDLLVHSGLTSSKFSDVHVIVCFGDLFLIFFFVDNFVELAFFFSFLFII